MNQLKSCWGQNSSTRKKLKVQHNFISVTWKQIKTETDQKNPGSLLIIWNFMRFLLLSRKSLKTHFMRNFPFYYSVSRIIHSITLFMGYIFLGIFQYFWSVSSYFWSVWWFPEKASNSQFVDRILLLFDLFPHIFGPLLVFKKNHNFQFFNSFLFIKLWVWRDYMRYSSGLYTIRWQ